MRGARHHEPSIEVADRPLNRRVRGSGRPSPELAHRLGVEFAFPTQTLHLIDELLTPDSSRFWPADEHVPGREPPSWDKQILRNHLETLDWNHEPPPPALPCAEYHEISNRETRRRRSSGWLEPPRARRW